MAVTCLALAACGDDDRPAPVDAGAGDGATIDSGDPTCSSGTTMCSDRCVDTNESRMHCGGCDVACDVGEACIDGACGILCPAGQTECDGACVDVLTDARHCSGCGTPCATGEICVDGACETSCPSGQEVCGAVCVDTQSNPSHCGACDGACAVGEVCSEGVCASACGAGLLDCAGACVDTQNDPANCGDCGTVCSAPTGGAGLCMAGTCRSVCDPLFGDCNADVATDGCETPLATDPVNCGACGNVCSLANAVAGCAAGGCAIAACDAGFDDCDSMAANGCETSVVGDPANCGGCGVACAAGEGCYGGMCLTQGTGEDCTSPWYLVDGLNTVAWTATTSDYVATSPACVAVGDVTGPDLVLAYTAATSGTHRLDFDKPTSTRWVAVVSTAACGTLTPELACISDWSPATMGGSFSLTAGETAFVYVRDTDSGTNPLSNPLMVTLTSPTTPSTPGSCTPGSGGVVGTTTTRIPTGVASFSEYYVAADSNPTGYVYFGGLTDLYRMPKAGGTVEDVAALAGLGPTHLGYAMFIDGSNIYTIESNETGLNGRIWRISTDGGATWNIQDYAHFPVEPNDDFRTATVRDGRIYLVTENDDTSPTTELWSLDSAAPVLPAVATLEQSVSGEGDCNGMSRDASYFYLLCDDGDRLVRVPVSGGTPELITDTFSVSSTTGALYGDDLDADGTFDILYVQTWYEEIYTVCDPAGASPTAGDLVDLGGSSSNYGMGFDRASRVLWFFDDDTQELVSVQ